MEHDDPITNKTRWGGLDKTCKSESAKADPEDVVNTYGIDHLKIGEAKHDSDDSK